MMEIEGIAIVRFDENGEISYHVASDARFRLFIVDERCPNDRVYEWLPRCDNAAAKAILGDDEIGSSADARHPAIEAVILAHMEGRSHLRALSDARDGQGEVV